METFELNKMIKENDDLNKCYDFNKNENNSYKSLNMLHRNMYNTSGVHHFNNNLNKDIANIQNEVKKKYNLKKDVILTSDDDVDEENSSCTECLSDEDNSYYSLNEGYKTNYIMESLFDKNAFVYFMVPFNKYNYTNYYTNWNKISFRIYASLNSVTEKKFKKRKTDNTNNNFNNPLISILNNFLYFLLLSEFLSFNEIFKLMPLCKSSYKIFNKFFYINVNINPFKQNIKDIINFLKENKEYQFNILKKKNYVIKNKDNFYDENEILNDNKTDTNDGVELYENSNCGNKETESLNKRNTSLNVFYDNNNIINNSKDVLNNDKVEKNTQYYKECNSGENINYVKKNSSNKVFFTNNIINMRHLFCLYEFMRVYLSKYNREKVYYCISDQKFKYDINKANIFFKDIFPYGNKISSFEYKVKLKKHIQRRWNLKGNYLHENYFHHKSNQSNELGILKLIENEQSQIYPSFTTLVTLDKFGCINMWKINDVNSLMPTFLFKSQLLMQDKKTINATDAVNIKSDNFLISDSSSLYHFSLENKSEIELKSVCNLSIHNDMEKNIKNMIITDNNKCCIGLNKAICYRIDLERGEVENCKNLNEDLQKINCFDTNTNIVLSKKHILIDDKRLPNYVCYVNYNLIDYENDKKYYNSDNFFYDCNLTGISLTSLNSNNSIYLFDLRYKYPSTCLYYENVVTETFSLTKSDKLKYLNDLKTNYNSRYYINNKKYSGYHDNIILYPYFTDKIEKTNILQKNYVRNKILSDESFIYTIIKEKKKELDNLPFSYLHMWRWCDKRQFKTFFHYYNNFNCKRNSDQINCYYKNLIFDSIYKLDDAPNHLFITYENSNYIHSLLPPSYGLHIKSSLKEVPFHMHPTNL
ncbi:conserved Plasmodium protein, unknown function [Plasmodium gallinaceum]|uniref:Uncharacterized protein n=1 Tax=Plasmodium gallinaceum TaxID=5849 RepID=A0A1J1GS81_PLAGA|nr:conserved Plasmodium protein, unknown function [Plasmodium gallinaceum]CRG95164.1 conserved Plasmodium protein, unknown function [Plasmodium gallinaceum]